MSDEFPCHSYQLSIPIKFLLLLSSIFTKAGFGSQSYDKQYSENFDCLFFQKTFGLVLQGIGLLNWIARVVHAFFGPLVSSGDLHSVGTYFSSGTFSIPILRHVSVYLVFSTHSLIFILSSFTITT